MLILFAAGLLITYFNSIATERMLFRDAENNAQLIAAEFNLTTRSAQGVDTLVLAASARLALRLLHEAEFIGFFQRVTPDSLSLMAFAGKPLDADELVFVVATLKNARPNGLPALSVKHGNSLYSYSVLLYGAGQVWGYALTDVTLSKVRQTVRRNLATGAAITLAVSIFASVLLLLAMRLTFLRPFDDLAEKMRDAAGGNLGARLSLSSGTEFRTLSSIFNEMMSELEKAHGIIRSEVKRQAEYNITLQKEIAAATDSLREKTDEIIALQEKLRLFESQAALGKVASRIAHELGSPLNAIYTSVQLLLENDIPVDAKKKLRLIERQAETMTAIINSSLQARKIAMPSKQKVPLKNLVEETRLVMEPRLKGKSVVFKVQLEESSAVISADPVQIQQVLMNLLNNSIEAIESRKKKESPGRIDLRAYKDKESESPSVRIDVSDNGEGIPQEIANQLFSDFIDSKKPAGNGIGLVICKEIVDRHGGKIFLAESSVKGSTFSMILPV